MAEKKPNCYKCKWRGDVPGDCHSSCHHPKCKKVVDDPLGAVMSILGDKPTRGLSTMTGLKVKGNPHGIKSGWFNHPINFDPVWLLECDGFEEKNN